MDDVRASLDGADPLFVMCMGRSGSTLLRFLLDAHPELACPPETNLWMVCEKLAVIWSLIEGAPLSAKRDAAPPQVPDAAIAGMRRMLDEMTGSYLARRGKSRFCDKSLGSARCADLLARIYPGAKFLCLYRHPMDMIRSGLDACPWGLSGYGFEPYLGSSGNSVQALARYWLDNALAIAAAEQRYPERSYRIRYEDLVENPEEVMREVYAFIGVRPAPGVTRTCFSHDREPFGPADHKIWATSMIHGDSVGSGESVPAELIAAPIAASINDLLDRLGYTRIGADWGTAGKPADPRLPGTVRGPAAVPGAAAGSAPADEPGMLPASLRAGLEAADDQFTRRWEPCATGRFEVVSRTAVAGDSELRWLVDIAARTITEEDVPIDDVDWSIVGSASAWKAVIAGQTNLLAATRRCDLRYCSLDEDSIPIRQTRVMMLADLLGLSSWGDTDPAWRDTTHHAADRTAAPVP
jgi:hypothetical protein